MRTKKDHLDAQAVCIFSLYDYLNGPKLNVINQRLPEDEVQCFFRVHVTTRHKIIRMNGLTAYLISILRQNKKSLPRKRYCLQNFKKN